jgi:hypothetical protein
MVYVNSIILSSKPIMGVRPFKRRFLAGAVCSSMVNYLFSIKFSIHEALCSITNKKVLKFS